MYPARLTFRESEWGEVEKFMWDNRKKYTGISLLPYDNGTYQQAPFEQITEEDYKKLSKFIHSIDLTKVIENEDLTDLSGEVACGGGGCEIK
jgi:ribonucleoside-triphosphate reductase